MSLFPETIARALAGGHVQAANLVRFDFTSETMRLWRDPGLLRTNDGAIWRGIGQFGSMSGIEQAVNGEAPEASFTLSGIDADIMRLARDEFEAEVRGRMVRVYVQFFGVDDPDDPDNQRVLDMPYPIWGARMLQPTFAMDRESGERSVTITAESLFALRSRPRHAMYTDRDQQHRFEGDRGFEFVGGLVNKVLAWPDY
ncbi:hypothetical protein [Sphingomonas sp. VNH70]|uniref:hypothetical protein n=1 Tax=Sphingomonas silueang TaxID=3156617 RepID=UPI0032B576F5